MARSDLRAFTGLVLVVALTAAWTSAMPRKPKLATRDAHIAPPVISAIEEGLLITAPTGYTIHFTLNGSMPDANAPVYTGPFTRLVDHRRIARLTATPTSIQWRHPVGDFHAAAVVRACACDDLDMRCGPVATRTFPPGDPGATLPKLALTLPQSALFDPDSGIYVVGHGIFRDPEIAVQRFPQDQRWWKYPGNFHFRGNRWERQAHIEYFRSGGRLTWGSDVAVRIQGNNTRGFPQHALRLSYALDSEGRRLGGHSSTVLRAAGNDQDRAFLRDAVQHALCAALPFETSGNRPCVVYINGAYWGIHEVRERVDADEIADRHGIKKKKFTILEDRALLDHGDSAEIIHFRRLVNKAEHGDPLTPGYMDSIAASVDLESFLTYMAAQIILGNTDWPDQNVKYWRYTGKPDSSGVKDGRWRFIMGDSDMGLGFNGGPEVDLFAHLAAKRGPVARLFNGIMRNASMRDRFRVLTDELLDGPLSGTSMTSAIEAQASLLRAEMPMHIRRWRRPVSLQAWERNVTEVLTFTAQRGGIVRRQLDQHLPPLQ